MAETFPMNKIETYRLVKTVPVAISVQSHNICKQRLAYLFYSKLSDRDLDYILELWRFRYKIFIKNQNAIFMQVGIILISSLLRHGQYQIRLLHMRMINRLVINNNLRL